MPARLLPLLAETPQSGAVLAAQLGVGRVTVHSLAHDLLAAGVPLLISRRGYAVAPGTPTPAALRRAGFSGPYRYQAQVGSTQDELRGWAEHPTDPAPSGAALLAESQRAGRGRRGRTWLSADRSSADGSSADGQDSNGAGQHLSGTGLTFSVLLRPTSLSSLPLLPLAAGVALRDACRAVLPPDSPQPGLKWPNDLLSAGGLKLAGVLLEADLRGEEVRRAVLGIGLNVSAAPPGAAALVDLAPGWSVSRAELLARILRELGKWQGAAPGAILDAWRSGNLTLGRAVRVQTPGGPVVGVARDLGPGGELLVRSDSGQILSIGAGDVELIGSLKSPGPPQSRSP
ncbi:bifunctional biotin--[acetyl-CoA-carboxylase] synthetase/biotin operon repressor [Deinococcus sp.]|uniref:bifunctional biotin--[acetyl-CoA-carboxylase] synthetase/biotin operon repressor n=1 Tax=Deinococcus sp. TaxID=47478 RepID=UPI0025F6850E|nr:bifunctional biotin--[acetyl-CoA-carboxylase] synthetase/biotin operon repressor [Deinococcus sp.]